MNTLNLIQTLVIQKNLFLIKDIDRADKDNYQSVFNRNESKLMLEVKTSESVC